MQRTTFTNITEFEYWILEIAIFQQYPLSILFSKNLDTIVNKCVRLPESEQLKLLLEQMILRGYLNILDSQNIQKYDSLESLKSCIKLNADFAAENYYGVTQQGGELWEAITRPNWSQFVNISYSSSVGQIISASRSMIEKHIAMEIYNGHIIYPSSLKWDKVQPLQVTYWKYLPIGHSVKFKYSTNPFPPSLELNMRKRWWNWTKRINNGWYKKPFQ